MISCSHVSCTTKNIYLNKKAQCYMMSFIASGIDHNKDLRTGPEEQGRLAWKI